MLGSAVAFQSAFRAEMHQNDVFFFFLKSFLRSAHQNDPKQKKIKFLQKKLIFLKTRFAPRSQTDTKSLCLAYT